MMYINQSVQLFAYAVFIPAGAYYVSKTMDELDQDQVKGQAFITSAVCAVGVEIAFIAMTRLPHRKK